MRFGHFTFDPSSGELRGPEGTSRLAPQVAAVLGLLTTRAGEVVTRAELRDALWPETTVEFDQGLNFCIRQLRIALDDDASAPRYIETLPRRGYRFVASIEGDTGPADVVAAAESHASSQGASHEKSRRASGGLVIACGIAVLAASALFAVPKYLTGAVRGIAVLTFDVPAGDTVLAAYSARLTEDLVADLTREHARDLVVMGPSFTRRFPGTSTNPDSVRAALHATHLLSGTLTRADGGIRVFAQLIRLDDHRHIMAIRLVDSVDTETRRRAIADSIGGRAGAIALK